MPSIKQQALDKAKELGVAVFKGHLLHADAPRGMCFEEGLHYIICEDWHDLLDRLQYYGVRKCDVLNCEVCKEEADRRTATEYAVWMGWELILDSSIF